MTKVGWREKEASRRPSPLFVIPERAAAGGAHPEPTKRLVPGQTRVCRSAPTAFLPFVIPERGAAGDAHPEPTKRPAPPGQPLAPPGNGISTSLCPDPGYGSPPAPRSGTPNRRTAP